MTLETFTPHGGSVVTGIGPYAVAHPYTPGSLQVFTDQGGLLVALAPGEWSVTPAESDTAGNIYLTSPVATREAGRTLYIRRTTPGQQGWQGVLGEREAGLEAQLDLLTMGVQEAARDCAGALRVAAGTVPAVAPRALTVLGFDADKKLVLIDQASFEIGPGMLLLASGAPTGALGKDGDLCIVAATGNLHARAAGVWSLVGNLAGPPGPPASSTPYMATVLAAIDAPVARTLLGLEISAQVQAFSQRLSELVGIAAAEGTLAVKNAAGLWVALAPGAALNYLRRNAANNAYEFGVPPSGAWAPFNGSDGIFYSHAVHGTVASFLGPDYLDQTDVLFLFEEMSHNNGSATELRNEFYLETSAVYGSPEGLGQSGVATDVWNGWLQVQRPYRSQKDCFFNRFMWGGSSGSSGNSGGTNINGVVHRSTTAQRRLRSRFSWGGGLNDLGIARCFVRASKWQ